MHDLTFNLCVQLFCIMTLHMSFYSIQKQKADPQNIYSLYYFLSILNSCGSRRVKKVTVT